MKSMRRFLATATAAVMGLGVVLASGVAARAQDETKPPTAPTRAGRQRAPREYRAPILGQIQAAKIELAADQKAKLKTLTDKMMAERKTLQDKNLAQDEQRRQTMALGRKFRTDVMAVLTDEQKAQLRASRGAARPGRARRNAPPAENASPAEKKTE